MINVWDWFLSGTAVRNNLQPCSEQIIYADSQWNYWWIEQYLTLLEFSHGSKPRWLLVLHVELSELTYTCIDAVLLLNAYLN